VKPESPAAHPEENTMEFLFRLLGDLAEDVFREKTPYERGADQYYAELRKTRNAARKARKAHTVRAAQ
jgi:hypothetical protein